MKRKWLWIYVMLISVIYIGIFLFAKLSISGFFSVENEPVYKTVQFSELPDQYFLKRYEPFFLDITPNNSRNE